MNLALGPRIVLATLWFVAYGCYSIWTSLAQPYWLGLAFGALSIVGGIGALLRLKWSQWLVYLVAAVVIGTWLYYLTLAVRLDGIPYDSLELTALSLVPGFVLFAGMLWSSDVVRRRFSRQQLQA